MERKTAWEKYTKKQKTEVMTFAEGYRQFISDCKTERECVTEFVKIANNQGFKDLSKLIEKKGKLKAGDKVYLTNMGKAMVLFVIGKEPLEKGMNILGAHIDSPRLDLKQNPLYEDSGLAMMDTHYYGGIKKYQWVTLPMALHGVIATKEKGVIEINIGEKELDPVFGVSDLLIHLAADQMDKKVAKAVKGEALDICVGSIPLKGEEKDAVKKNVLKILKDKYGIVEEDFISAEIEVVPAGSARDYGFDRSMIMGYGQDDRVCAYPSFWALMNTPKPDKTAVCLLVDKEEIGSVGATGMHSRFFENTVAEVLELMGCYSELTLRRAMSRSKVLSSDVSAG
ncbi:MAG: aminopeptidase, partial [Lachnospiraceae bacterium]|nr:aminopeptidase [Lachnospiraceae bacterium]